MTKYARQGYIKAFWLLVLFLLYKVHANATTYMGKDNNNVQYYICQDNKEVADLLGYDNRQFDLSVYYCDVMKADYIRTAEESDLYVVMIREDDSFVVAYRAREYDIFFYSDKIMEIK